MCVCFSVCVSGDPAVRTHALPTHPPSRPPTHPLSTHPPALPPTHPPTLYPPTHPPTLYPPTLYPPTLYPPKQDGQERGLLHDPLPAWLRRQHSLPQLLPALREMHAPSSERAAAEARRRMAFQELLALQLKLLVQRSVAW